MLKKPEKYDKFSTSSSQGWLEFKFHKFCWWEERQSERESWAFWHWERLRAVPPLVQRVRTASDSSGQAMETKHLARAWFRWRHAISRPGPDGTRRWHSHNALWSRSHVGSAVILGCEGHMIRQNHHLPSWCFMIVEGENCFI